MADDPDFDTLMSHMGVQPLQERPAEARPPRRRIAGRPIATPEEAPTETPPPPPVEEETPDPSLALVEALSDARAELTSLQARIAELEAELRQPPGDTALAAMWDERGIRGADEARRVVLSLAQKRSWDKLEGFLRLDRAGSVNRLLGNQLVLLCPDNCRPAEGFAVLEVEAARCEACGGFGLDAAAKALSEALMLHGIRKLNVIGGSLFGRRILREGVDSRVKLTPMAGTAFADTAPPAQEEDCLWVAWTGCPGDPAQGNWSNGGPLVVTAPSVAGLFKAVIQALEERD